MLGSAPSTALDLTTETGIADEFLPELPALRLTQDPVHRHKDLFRHTLAVLENLCALQEEPDLPSRMAALFHDVGKPKTRRIDDEGVSFHHHEVVGAEMAEHRLRALRYPSKIVEEVRQLVYLHMRFHTYRMGWSDRAVRRYVRDAGELLPKLNALVRADCTTRNEEKARRLSRRMDELVARIAELAASEQLSRIRPTLDGREIMSHLGIEPGPLVGEALDYLLEIRLDEGEISKEEAYRRLDEWWEQKRGQKRG
jgi:poly(A) polymerase